MDTGIYIIWDIKADARVGGIILAANNVVAIRAFRDLCEVAHPNNFLRAHPDDYQLRHAGTLTVTGRLEDGDQATVTTATEWVTNDPPRVDTNLATLLARANHVHAQPEPKRSIFNFLRR